MNCRATGECCLYRQCCALTGSVAVWRLYSEGMAEESLEPSSTSPKPSPTSERASTDGSLPTGTSPEESPNTPSRKNKRKSSEPRRRSDFGVKRFCADPDTVADPEAEQSVRELPPDTPDTVISSGSTPDPEEKGGGQAGVAPVPPQIGWYSTPIQGAKGAMRAAKKGSKKNHPDHKSHSGVKLQQLSQQPVVHSLPIPPVLPGASPTPRESPNSTSSTPGFPPVNDDDYDDDSPTFLDPITGRPTKRSRKNYKNMTRERRVEANARERSRVHTISAAFESLRRAVPSYSYNQKLSKLAILRIACSYIMALSKLANVDICEKANNFSFIDCVDLCTQTIQTEGRARRRH